MTATIRPATFHDAPQLTDAIRAAYAVYDNMDLNLPPVSEGIDQAIRDATVFVAEKDERLLGGIVVRVGQGWAQIENLALTPAATGLGLGKALIQHAEEAAREAGATELRLATHKDLTGNIGLYTHLGWAITARDGNKVMMRKPL